MVVNICLGRDELRSQHGQQATTLVIGASFQWRTSFILEFIAIHPKGQQEKQPITMFPAILITATICLLAGYLYGWHQRGQLLVDSLTGLADKTAFNQDLDHATEFHGPDRPLVICFLDVDQLKRVNDHHGHLAGDHLLEAIAATMEDTFPGRCYRWGGDEFTSLLAMDLSDAEQLAESMRLATEKIQLEYDGMGITATVSIGLAMLAEGKSSRSVLQDADRAMYACKENGGNSVSTVYSLDQG